MTEISYDEARTEVVRRVIGEFPSAEYVSGPEPVNPQADIFHLRYRCVIVETGDEFEIIIQRDWGLEHFLQESIRQQIRANLNQKAGAPIRVPA
jgi:hypothetical protein